MSEAEQQVMSLTAASQARQQAHVAVQERLQIQSVAATLAVPTLPERVRATLRRYGQPVRLFGENPANVRDRLRILLATLQVRSGVVVAEDDAAATQYDDGEEEVTKYTRADPELLQARQKIAQFSLQRAAARLAGEARLREGARCVLRKRKKESATTTEEEQSTSAAASDESVLRSWNQVQHEGFRRHRRVRELVLEASQYADRRALAAVRSVTYDDDGGNGARRRQRLVVSAGWTATVQVWDATSLSPRGERTLCHEDRIMGMAASQPADGAAPWLCTASLDRTAKLWQLRQDTVTEMNDQDQDDTMTTFSLEEKAHFQGHEARLCRTAFHPMQQHVATTSFDHTWRLWDMETEKCLLLQDGHWKQVFGIDFHGDGSLVATTDVASVVQLWDLRTGRAVHHFLGHAKRVLCADFSPNGFHLATAGDDGFVKVWDLRRRKPVVSIPAHSNLISQVRFEPTTGDTLVSTSFDGTAKVWSGRDWKLLNTLMGHDGKVSGIDFVEHEGLVTCGYDRTLKTWQ